MRSPWPIIVTTLVGMAAIAVVVYHFTRETTSVETKYLHRTADEIDATYNDPLAGLTESPYYSDNTSPGTGPQMDLGDDPDHDGLTNTREDELGTDQRDPDTDNDGTSDGIEVVLGTDPLDKTVGGTAFPPVIVIPPIIPVDHLTTEVFYKNVKNITQADPKWTHYTTAKSGDHLSFLIYAELTNTSTANTLSAKLTDKLGTNLQYPIEPEEWGHIRINNGAEMNLPEGWMNGYNIPISPYLNPQKPVPVEITFEASVQFSLANILITTTNQALLVSNEIQNSDLVFIRLTR